MKISYLLLKGGYYNNVAALVYSGKLKLGSKLQLRHNPNNLHDDWAVEVRLESDGTMLGHLARGTNKKFVPILQKQIVDVVVYKIDSENKNIITVKATYDEVVSNEELDSVKDCFSYLPGISGVYCIRRKGTKQVYIGSSKNIRERIYTHFRDLARNIHHNENLQSDFLSAGISGFEVAVLRPAVSERHLEDLEREEIRNYRNRGYSLYNATDDGKGVFSNESKYAKLIEEAKIINQSYSGGGAVKKNDNPLSVVRKSATEIKSEPKGDSFDMNIIYFIVAMLFLLFIYVR